MNERSYPRAAVRDLVSRVETWNPQRAAPALEFDYIDIAAIDRESKTIGQPTRVKAHDAPSRARQLVKANDVLVSTVRPNLNAVAVVPQGLDGATASTGYCILRPSPERLDHRYLFHWVRAPEFIGEMTRLSTGANYPAVTDRIICESTIPLPPLSEQERIAAILDQADAVRRKRHQAIQTAAKLPMAIFLEMFGDPATNVRGWSTVQFGELLSDGLRNGESPATSGAVRGEVLTLNAITGLVFDPGARKEAEFAHFHEDSRVSTSDFLICRGNGNKDLVGTGKQPTIDMPDTLFPDTMIAARLDTGRTDLSFLQSQWETQHVRHQILQGARTTNGTYKINQQLISSIRLIAPPFRVQTEFGKRVETVESVLVKQEDALAEATHAFNSLVQHAFGGVL